MLAVFLAVNVLYWSTFVGRAVLSERRAPRPAENAYAGATVQERAPARIGYVAHLTSFAFLYAGLAAGAASADPVRTGIGSALIALAWLLTMWTLSVFRSWRLRAVAEAGHELMTTGPFRLVRHPIYAALMLVALGMAVCVPLPTTAVGLALNIAGAILRANAEEMVMLTAFPSAYPAYAARVRRFLPYVY
jgi:protein-S-isoprenylcysteine O-methyltransferase Ste14